MTYYLLEECDEILALQQRLETMDRSWTLSPKKKRRKGKTYTFYYKQTIDPDTGKRHEKYVRRSDQDALLTEFHERLRIKKRLLELRKRVKNVRLYGKADMLEVYKELQAYEQHRENIALGERMKHLDPFREELRIKHVSPDGILFDSKNELAIDGFLKYLGIHAVHNEEIDPDKPYSRTVDFTFHAKSFAQRQKFYLECMGRTNDPVYNERQEQKLREYANRGITMDKNLLVVRTHNNQLLMSDLIWELMRFGIVTPAKVRKRFKLKGKRRPIGHTFTVVEKKLF